MCLIRENTQEEDRANYRKCFSTRLNVTLNGRLISFYNSLVSLSQTFVFLITTKYCIDFVQVSLYQY